MSIGTVALLAATAVLAAPATTVEWKVVDLGAGPDSYPAAVNDRGQVAVNRSATAYLWHNGTLTDLGDLGGGYAIVNDVNNRGEAVGWSYTADNAQHAFLWRNGVMTDLGTLPGGFFSSAEAINDRGEIVGESTTADNSRHAFHWKNGVLTDLGGEESAAHDINDAGQVAGLRGNRFNVAFPVRWWHGQRRDLSTEQGTADAVNDRGHILINFKGDGSYDRSALWRNGRLTALEPPADATNFHVGAVNDRDQAVGFTADTPSDLDAVLWQNGRAVRLPNVGRVASAWALDNRGRIVGTSSVEEGSTETRAVMWVRG
ncbi:putative HAF family extracellular repeat protein [Actinoplanes campanulatus]|uniref:Putative HAF family extracellular repeat protein n=1 Tax=Actinoplanes campanulatus TaxID=113559 RepID=A0A7W5ASF6_9ACTN|nr:hypothetical protein [Actinoplanes campanulatus]MBB3101465.1 putative HAF family extracellular repeat protein [Actinoplanes campanulatus]GGN50267.1 hypothetical protein GCM10010109_89230 [Actinoplanes campanulatus]GID42473.1 hypothetical protein Aca09nite_89790 [Actinoplanes campanulatus]